MLLVVEGPSVPRHSGHWCYVGSCSCLAWNDEIPDISPLVSHERNSC